jgi:hypothetical protein
MKWNGALLGNTASNVCAVFDVTRQLATGRINVITSGFANRGDETSIQ